MGASALAQQIEELLTLLGGESRLPTALALGVQATVAMVRDHITPPTDRRGRGVDMPRHLPDTPACLQQGDGDATADFELEFGTLRSHADRIGRPSCHFSFFKDQ